MIFIVAVLSLCTCILCCVCLGLSRRFDIHQKALIMMNAAYAVEHQSMGKIAQTLNNHNTAIAAINEHNDLTDEGLALLQDRIVRCEENISSRVIKRMEH